MSNYCPRCGEPACFCREGAKLPSVMWNGMTASVDTHAERCDVKQAQPARVGSAVPEGQTPKGGSHA